MFEQPQKIIKNINSYITLELFPITQNKHTDKLNSYFATMLLNAINNLGIIPNNDQVRYVNYLNTKRSFILTTVGRKNYHLAVKFHENFSWIYEIRRWSGHEPCCARSHATGLGLPEPELKMSMQSTTSQYTTTNTIPCQRCFLEYADKPQVYIDKVVENNRINLSVHELRDQNTIAAHTIILLASGFKPFNDELTSEERAYISYHERLQMVQSQLNSIKEVKVLADQLIANTNAQAESEFVDDGESNSSTANIMVLNTVCRTMTVALEQIETNLLKLDVGKVDYNTLFGNAEFIVTYKRHLQALEFAYMFNY